MKEIVLTGEGYWDLDCTPYENIEGQIMQKDSVSRVQCIKIGEKIFYKKLFDEDMEESDGKILWYNSVLLPFIFKQIYQNFNLYRALKDSYDETHCKIDTNCVYYYYNFFEQRMKCLRDILDSCKQKETKGEEEK